MGCPISLHPSVIPNATPHSHAPATNVCFGIYRTRYSVDAETSSA